MRPSTIASAVQTQAEFDVRQRDAAEIEAPKPVTANAIRVAKILTGEIKEDTGDSGKDKAAQALGRKGGAARRDKLTPERRAEIARKAAQTRWRG